MAYRGPSIGNIFGFLWRLDVAAGLWYYISGAITIVVVGLFYYGLLLMYENPDSAATRLAITGFQSAEKTIGDFASKHADILAEKAIPGECEAYRAMVWEEVVRADGGNQKSQRIVNTCEQRKLGVGIPSNYQERAKGTRWYAENAELPEFAKLPKRDREALVRQAAAQLGLASRDVPGVPATRGNYQQAYFEAKDLWDIRRAEHHTELVQKWESDYDRTKN